MGGRQSAESLSRNNSSCSNRTLQDNANYVNIPKALTSKEKQAIRLSWKAISPNIRDTGMLLFIRFFQRDEVHKDFFPAFQDLSLEQLTSSLVLRAHGTTVMMAFMSLVSNLDNQARFHDILASTARSHQSRGVGIKEYEAMFETFLEIMSDTIGPQFQGAPRQAWERLASLAIDVIRHVQEENVHANGNISPS